MTTNPTVGAIDDRFEVLYLRLRRLARRRLLVAIAATSTLVIGLLGAMAIKHQATAWWLGANQFVVLWGIDRTNWKQGGSSSARYSSPNTIFASERPDLDLKFLNNLQHLEELDLSTLLGLRESDLTNLDGLTDLRLLNLDRSHHPILLRSESNGLTDASLVRIGRLTRLEELHLGGQRITDAGLKELAKLDRLESLYLAETPITDASLELLKTFPSLKSVDLSRTNVTAQGVSDFERLRPATKVVTDLPFAPPSTPDPKPKADR